MRIVKLLLPMLLVCGAAYGQSQVQPMVQTGVSPTTRCAVGGSNGTGCPVPVTVTSGGGGSTNPAAGATGSAVPASASYNGVNVGGNLQGQTGVNPSGSVYAGQNDLTSVGGTTISTGTGAQGAGTPRVTVATDTATVAGSASLPAGTNVIGHAIIDTGSTTAVTQATGTNLHAVIDSGSTTAATQATGTNLHTVTDSTSVTTLIPATTGGLSNYVVEPAASDNHAVIKNGAGQVYGIEVFNNSATVNYIRLYNAGTGFNGCNSATGLVWEGHIPSNSTSDAGFALALPPQGIAFGTGISICVTSGYGQTNTTNATASAMSVNVQYQ